MNRVLGATVKFALLGTIVKKKGLLLVLSDLRLLWLNVFIVFFRLPPECFSFFVLILCVIFGSVYAIGNGTNECRGN